MIPGTAVGRPCFLKGGVPLAEPKRHIIPLFVPHAGCPHDCVFCNQRKITGADTPITPDEVRQQIEAAASDAGRGCELAFYGGSFTAIEPETQEALLSAAMPFYETGLLASIRVSTRPDAIDPEVLARLKRYHVETVELGCQSMDDGVLQRSGRGHTAEAVQKASVLLKHAGFRLILQMMTGLPGDDGEASRKTADSLIALQPDGVRIYPTVVLRDTGLERMMKDGVYAPHTVEDAIPLCADLYEKFLVAGIPVIRLGLNPTDLLSDGEAVAGAYHPALGELVLSELFRRKAEGLLQGAAAGSALRLLVHPSRISVMAGQHRANLIALKKEFSLSELRVAAGEQDLWSVAVEAMPAKSQRGCVSRA